MQNIPTYLNQIRNDRDKDSDLRDALMVLPNGDTTALQIQTRGNFRLNKRNCDFPPLRLNLKKEAVKGTLFEGQDKLKLVVPCKLGQEYWAQYVLSEYLAYRMLNVLTPLSFRVRLARVTYIDSTGKDDPVEERYGFVIEDLDDDTFTRVRIGVGRPPGRMDPADYVLRQMRPKDWAEFESVVPQAAQCVVHILEHGVDSAMQEFNAD